MYAKVEIAPLEFTKVALVVCGYVLLANVIKMDQRMLFRAFFDELG